MNTHLICRLIIFCGTGLLFFATSCLKDDFSKRAESVWNPDFAFPIVNTTLNVDDILIQNQSPTQLEINGQDVVEIIYHSENMSKSVDSLIQLPNVNYQESFSMRLANSQAFNQTAAIGSTQSDSSQFNYSYSLDSQLGAASRLDTVIFKGGRLHISFSSSIPQNVTLTIFIPGLYLNNQPFQQTLSFNSSGQTPVLNELSRDLEGAYLVTQASENIRVKCIWTVEKTNAQVIPLTDQLQLDLKLENQQFKRLNGYFQGLQMPVRNTDTLFLRLFKNVIAADQLNFQNPEASISITNSTGIPLGSTIQSFLGYRSGVSIPPVNLNSVSFPVLVPKQAGNYSTPGRSTLLFNETNGSNFKNVVNLFPKYMITTSSNVLNHQTGVGDFLLDTSRIRVYSEVRLPLDGLTLNLLVNDTFDFKFTDITRDIERALIRVNTSNGFPLNCNLQIYFCKQNENLSTAPLAIIDSLYNSGTELLLLTGQIATAGPNAGSVISPSVKISDAVISGERWKRLGDLQSNKILVRGRFTTTASASEIVKIKDGNKLDVRIAAQLKIKKSF